MIRTYQETDIEAILNVWYQASLLAHPFLDAAFLEKEAQHIRDIYMPNTQTWIYEKDQKIAGFIAMMGNEVGAIFVHPDFHGQGIGTQLMHYVAQFHATLEVEVFEKNVIGRAFYDKYGFKTIKERIHEDTQERLQRMKFTK